MTRGMDTDVRLILISRVESFRDLKPEELQELAESLQDPEPKLVHDIAVAFAAHDTMVERMIDVAPSELIVAVRTRLQELKQWSEAARLTAANTTVGTFYYQTFEGPTCQDTGEWLTITWDGVVWNDQSGEQGRYPLGTFAATNASDLRARTRAIPPHVLDRAVACAAAFLAR